MKDLLKFSARPKFENPSLIVGWNEDAGRVSPTVIEYLSKKIKTTSFCEIEPAGFFSLAAVAVDNDIALFPENKFYYGERDDLVIFKGSEPQVEQYRFLSAIIHLAQRYCIIKDLYTISGTIAPIAHTAPRRISAVFNERRFQQSLRSGDLEDMTWSGPPAVSSYLLWIANRSGIPGVSLWPQVPFYLAAAEDLQAARFTLSFLDSRFKLGLDLIELDQQIEKQNARIARLRQEDSDIDRYIGILETELSLGQDEQIELTRKVTELLERED